MGTVAGRGYGASRRSRTVGLAFELIDVYCDDAMANEDKKVE
jgi:hypothetical protein